MINGGEVLSMLIPQGGWIISGDQYEGITWVDESVKITKKEFTDGFAAYPAWKAKQEAEAAAAKQAILDRLGITIDDVKLLLS